MILCLKFGITLIILKEILAKFPKWLAVITKRYAIDIIRKEKKHKNNIPLDENIKCVVSGVENDFERKTDLEDIKKE